MIPLHDLRFLLLSTICLLSIHFAPSRHPPVLTRTPFVFPCCLSIDPYIRLHSTSNKIRCLCYRRQGCSIHFARSPLHICFLSVASRSFVVPVHLGAPFPYPAPMPSRACCHTSFFPSSLHIQNRPASLGSPL
ncbi:hypothetical protein V8D89_012475 [Ganoderma adspersum]